MTLPNLKQSCKIYLEFTIDGLKPLIRQILESDELIQYTNQISVNDSKKIDENIEKISKIAIEKETKYYIKKYKIKTTNKFLSLFENLSSKEISIIRKNLVKESIIEFSKNG